MKKSLYFSMRLALLGCIAFAACGAVFAAPFTVSTTNDTRDVSPGDGVCIDSNGMCSLRAAISEANALAGDDIITLPAGAYTARLYDPLENNNGGNDFDITSNITINGAGSDVTFIQGATTPKTAPDRPLDIYAPAPNTATVVINDVTLRHGRFDFGVGGLNGGAGLRVQGSGADVTLNNVVIRDNEGLNKGAGIQLTFELPLVKLNNCLITNNSINVTTGSANAGGGGIEIESGIAIINNSTISENSITSSVSSTFGAGIEIRGGTLNLTNSTVNNNSATGTTGFHGHGGGIYNQGATLNIINSTVGGNYADSGGGIRMLAKDTEATTTINNSSIVNNNNAYEGGGITNIALGNGNSTLNLNNSTVSRNVSGYKAAGIWNITATDAATNTGFAIANINFSTIAENFIPFRGEAGGVFNELTRPQPAMRTLRLKNSVIANNDSGNNGYAPDIEGQFLSQGYNLIENTEGAGFTPTVGDTTGIDPSLGALGLNGGTTLNYLPNPGSPLIDRIPNGVNGCGGFDQRGVSRPADSDMNGVAACEKGSTERVSAPTAASVSVTGRILSSSGRGIINAVVVMTDPNGNTRFARTSTFGYYRFDDVQIGGTYIFTVSSKRYEFAAIVRTITEETRDLNFLAP